MTICIQLFCARETRGIKKVCAYTCARAQKFDKNFNSSCAYACTCAACARAWLTRAQENLVRSPFCLYQRRENNQSENSQSETASKFIINCSTTAQNDTMESYLVRARTALRGADARRKFCRGHAPHARGVSRDVPRVAYQLSESCLKNTPSNSTLTILTTVVNGSIE